MNFLDKKQIKTNRRLRILYFTPLFTFSHSRTETYLTNEVNILVKNYPDIEFLIYVVNTPKKNRVIKINDRILRVNRKSYNNFLFFKEMIKIFIKFKPNIIHSHYVVPSIIINFFAKIFRIPTILHGRGEDVNYFPFHSAKSKMLLLIAGKLNDRIITVSKSTRDNFLRFKTKRNKVKVIYNGINFNYFNPREKIFFSSQYPLEILHVGRFHVRKGQHHIIEACKKLKDNNVKFHLTLIGGGPLRKLLVELIKKYELEDYVDLLGWIDYRKIPNYMQKADVLVFPSITEGLPNVVLEAMSMKLAVILTRIGGNLELAQDKGSILVDTNNPQQLFEGILYYYNHPKELEIGGEINRNFIINSFSWDVHGKKLYQEYESLIKKRRV